jgi:ADP-dependent NAD(P)H-hydrate dehydratase / NAD(P)H-hydrate epimerase
MTLPGWLQPLPDAAGQRAIDSWAIERRDIPGLTLMERAGAGMAEIVGAQVPDGRIVVVCGGGNNGGDGLVVARLLRDAGRDVTVLLLGDPQGLKGDAAVNLRVLPGPPPEPFAAAALSGAAGVVDAVLGTGFSGTPRDSAAAVIEAINQAGADGATTIACDVPSGVDSSTGEAPGAAVRAAATVTFNAGKPGLWIHPGKAHAGAVYVVDIGIPQGYDGEPPAHGLITDAVLDEIPRRGADSNKFTVGSVLVCGGSHGLTGAPAMAALAAARAGAGYVTIAAFSSVVPALQAKLLEVMVAELEPASALEQTLDRAARAQALVLGPGLGRDEDVVNFARGLARQVERPLVLDADGLNAHAGRGETLRQRQAPTILTPHDGELARLLGADSADISAHRLARATEASQITGAVVVLKGDDTIIADPDGRVAISPGGAPALATAGTGDVLSGVIGALLAKGLDPFTAASAGVLTHLRAGRRAGEEIGVDGVIASDVIARLPRAGVREG